MKVVKYIAMFILVLFMPLGVFATLKGIREAVQQLNAEASVEAQMKADERQSALDLVKARTEWYRNNTGAEQ